jgi:hypothetical protein
MWDVKQERWHRFLLLAAIILEGQESPLMNKKGDNEIKTFSANTYPESEICETQQMFYLVSRSTSTDIKRGKHICQIKTSHTARPCTSLSFPVFPTLDKIFRPVRGKNLAG